MSGSKPLEPRSNDVVGARQAKQEADKQVKEMDKQFEPAKDTATSTDTRTLASALVV
jgi:hypothetical protein